MKDIESLYLNILTNISHHLRPRIDPVRCCGICQRDFALGPWWGGLYPEDPIEQRTISNGACAQRSRGKLNNTPNSGLDDGPTGVVIVRINITQLRNAVDGDNGGAIGCQLARFSNSLVLLLLAEETNKDWVTYKLPMLKIPITCIFVPRRIWSFHSCGSGRHNKRKSVNTFILPMTIKKLLRGIQSDLIVGSQAPFKGLH